MNLIFTKTGYGTRFPNEYYECDDYIKIKIWNQEKEFFLIIDKDDFNKVNFCNWKIREENHTVYGCNSRHGFIHRIIMEMNDCNLQVDHINHNGLDNRKSNLRSVTPLVNSQNTRRTGVFFEDGRHPRWRAMWAEDGVKKSKSFSVKTYGENAKLLAIEWREKMKKELYSSPEMAGE